MTAITAPRRQSSTPFIMHAEGRLRMYHSASGKVKGEEDKERQTEKRGKENAGEYLKETQCCLRPMQVR
ncbi:hypothetical protein AGOR_G00159790 [Albula goreensis]|uniref:Uncharacterized protein n=1 Tax=Albula goreensis TaxID=1534307 RepID=A0A8T3D392_9TELE|nr:hypothetical protein AGOR_G00159790 [Albula goreensis]